MAKIDKTYNQLIYSIMGDGFVKEDTSRIIDGKYMTKRELPAYHISHNMKDGFPILTTKKIYTKNVISELCFFLKGLTNISYLLKYNNNIWNKDAYSFYKKKGGELSFELFITEIKKGNKELGDLGNVYGSQWRNYNGEYVDQLINLLNGMMNNPFSNRLKVIAWNPTENDYMALPPCHDGFMVSCYKIDTGLGFYLTWSQRSVDTFLGLPFNIASYAFLGEWIELVTGHKFLGIYGHLNNVHIYDPHWEGLKIQLQNDTDLYEAPKVRFSDSYREKLELQRGNKEFFNYAIDILEPLDFIIEDYKSFPPIKADMYEPNS